MRRFCYRGKSIQSAPREKLVCGSENGWVFESAKVGGLSKFEKSGPNLGAQKVFVEKWTNFQKLLYFVSDYFVRTASVRTGAGILWSQCVDALEEELSPSQKKRSKSITFLFSFPKNFGQKTRSKLITS